VLFTRLFIHDVGSGGNQDCLKLSGLNDFFVIDNEFLRCSVGGSGVDMVGCHDGVIAGNRFEDVGNAVQTKGGSTDISVHGNTVDGASGRAFNVGGSTGFEFFRPSLSRTAENAEARRIHVDANVILGASEAIAFVGCDACRATHNTIVSPGLRAFRILQETSSTAEFTFAPARDGIVANTIVVFQASALTNAGRMLNIGAGTDAASFTFSHTLFYATDVPTTRYALSGVDEVGSIHGLDPRLANAAAGDVTPATDGPAVGAGVAVAGVARDARDRCFAAPPTIGAIEP
jgi:hypothetical protein